MISNFQVFVNNFFKFFIKQGYKDSNLELTESESVALPFGDSPSLQHSKLYDSTWILSIPFFKKLFSSYSSVTDTLSLIIYRNDFFKHAPVQ